MLDEAETFFDLVNSYQQQAAEAYAEDNLELGDQLTQAAVEAGVTAVQLQEAAVARLIQAALYRLACSCE
ncbi:MAG: hypothetical protein KDK97_16355, partial [Verrucomicrobiales bacterium]|nr:hypothetical protein [Verrucomicrobiales bacterium]